MSRDGWAALPRGATGFSAACDCGISWSYSLTIFANNKDADHSAHLPNLISAFVIRLLESFLSKLATGEISIFKLVPVAEETGLSLICRKPENRFSCVKAQMQQM